MYRSHVLVCGGTGCTSSGSQKIIEALENESYPIMLTHWQSLASNGLYTGLKILDKVAQRVNDNLSDKVQWTKAEDLMNYVVNNREKFLTK